MPYLFPFRTLVAFSWTLLAAGVVLADSGAVPMEGPPFDDLADSVGLDFMHESGRDGHYYFPEIMGAGAALFDADGDGDLDAYLVQGGPLAEARRGADLPSDAFFVNRLEEGALRFVDSTAGAGFSGAVEYGMGVAAGDYDGDGDVDLFLANFGPNQLWRNRGDGTFENVTGRAGVGDPRWSVSASFVDYDGDDDLDLYVANYVIHSFDARVVCRSATGAVDFCGPQSFTAERDQLLRNRGDGTFEDVSAKVLGTAWTEGRGAGLGVASADFDGDGRTDLYVANDLSANHLWLHRDGRLVDEALLAGCALSGDGEAEASMGVAVGDADGDGDPDLFLTHLDRQTHTLYRNEGDGFFADASLESGLGHPSWNFTGFGTVFLDYDGDGVLDLFVANGRVTEDLERKAAGESYALGERDQLFRGLGGGRFREVPAAGDLARPGVGRGVAAGDVDNDGDVDLLVSQNHGPPRLLVNRSGSRRPWIGLRPVRADGRDAPGTEVWIERQDGPTLYRRSSTDGSYASAGDPRITVGLGDHSEITGLRVRRPDGTEEHFAQVPIGRYVRLVEGMGRSGDAALDGATAEDPRPQARRPVEEPVRSSAAARSAAEDGGTEDPRRLYASGVLAQANRRLEEAEAHLERVREQVPEAAPEQIAVELRLAEVYRLRGRVDDAERLFRSLVEDPALAPGAAAYARLGLGRLANARADSRAAVDHLVAAVAAAPEAGAVWQQLALAYRRLGRLDEAREAASKAGPATPAFEDPWAPTDRDAGGATAQLLLGNQRFRAGRLDEALTHHRRARELAPEDPSTARALALTLEKLGRLDEALGLYAEAARQSGGDPLYLYDEARARWQTDAPREAVAELLGRVVTRAPDFLNGRLLLAAALGELGDADGAEEHLRAALELSPGEPRAVEALVGLLGARARERLAAGDFERAAEHLEAAVSTAPEDPETRALLARALLGAGREQDAARHLRQLVELDDPPADALLAWAQLLASAEDASLRDGPRAVEWARRAFERRREPIGAETMASALASAGAYELAVEWQERLLEQMRALGAGPEILDRLEGNLARYRAGRPGRAPWQEP